MRRLYFSRSFFYLTGIYLLLNVGIAAFGPTMMAWVSETLRMGAEHCCIVLQTLRNPPPVETTFEMSQSKS
jgi:hypothetical protein